MLRDCLAVRVRLIGRAITAVYDRAVEKEGVTIAQVNLLVALGKIGPCSPTRLGMALQMERSTVSRNLGRLLQAGWIGALTTDGKGVKEIALTAAGRKKIVSVTPHWRKAQKVAAGILGRSGVEALKKVAGGIPGQ